MHPGILFTLVRASHERRQREAAREAAATINASPRKARTARIAPAVAIESTKGRRRAASRRLKVITARLWPPAGWQAFDRDLG